MTVIFTYMLHVQTLTTHIWKWFHGFITLFAAGTTHQVQMCIHPKYQLHHAPLSTYPTMCTKMDKTLCFSFIQSSGRKWPPIKKREVVHPVTQCSYLQRNWRLSWKEVSPVSNKATFITPLTVSQNTKQGFVWDGFKCPSVRKAKFIQIHLQWYIHIYSCSVHLHPIDSPRQMPRRVTFTDECQ
jgi:hypothetical protein